MKGLYSTGTWLTFWNNSWVSQLCSHLNEVCDQAHISTICVVEHSPDCIFNVDRCNIQWCQRLGNEIIATYHHIFVIPSHYTDPYHQSDSVLYTLYTRTGLKFYNFAFTQETSCRYCSKKIHCTKNTSGFKNPSVLCRLMLYWWHTLYYCQLNFVAALLNFVGTLPAEPFFCLFNFGVFQKGME